MTSETTNALTDLGLRGLAEGLDDFLARATTERLSPVQIVEALVVLETDDRARRSLLRRQSRAKIGSFKPICDFDFAWPKAIDRDAVERALKLRFVDEGANLIIAGAHGLGKTMILKNVAHQAVLSGHAVLFTTAQKMLGKLSSIDSPTKLERMLRHFSSIKLLCIDEVGYLSYDSRAADLLFEVVNRRYEAKKSVALTTNLAFKDWTTVFPNATCTVALVDRLCHRADILKVEGDSWRKKEAMERQERREEEVEL
jgi:DNA replication protein DnaC